jgi:hypothetical protein
MDAIPADADEKALAEKDGLAAATESLLDGVETDELDWTADFSDAITNESSAHVGRRRCRSEVRAVATGAAAASGSASLVFSFLTDAETAGEGAIAGDAAASKSVASKMTGVATRADGGRRDTGAGATAEAAADAAAPSDSADEADE